jgi:hypothetical protein
MIGMIRGKDENTVTSKADEIRLISNSLDINLILYVCQTKLP